MAQTNQNPLTQTLLRWSSSSVASMVLLAAIAFAALIAGGSIPTARLPGTQTGYEPAQPIAFSHRLHAGELTIACVYCHSGAEKSRYAGVPSANVCMNCHRFVPAAFGAIRAEDDLAKKEGRAPRRIVSPEIQKLYDALAVGPDLKPDPAKQPQPIAWAKIHNVPDFVYFDHRPHVNAGVACQTCHGPVETMERVRQVSDLSMGWCVNCHRGVTRAGLNGSFDSAPAPFARAAAPVSHRLNPSIDCKTCHF
jgi:hypothetical protein